MIEKSNEIIAKIRNMGPLGSENKDKIEFKIGETHEKRSVGCTSVFEPIYYIESADTYFQISGYSFKCISQKLHRLYEVEGVTEYAKIEEEKKPINSIWQHIKRSLVPGRHIFIPDDAFMIDSEQGYVEWLEPKEEK